MTTFTLTAESIALLLLLGLSAFCSSSETIFFSLNPLQVRRLGRADPPLGLRLHHLLAQPTRLLSAVLITNTIVNVAAASLSFVLARSLVPRHAEQVTIPAMTLLLLFFGEYGPKRAGLVFADRLVKPYVPVLEALVRLTAPLRFALERLTGALRPFFRVRGRTLSDEEFETVVDLGKDEGILNEEERAMVKAIIDLEDIRAADIMTPRVDILGIDLDDDLSTCLDAARSARRNFVLLYRGQLDSVEGFLDVRRYLLDPEHRLEAATIPPLYVPESAPLNRLLARFQRERRRIAVVVDEYGGTAGLVTRGDVLEEISGDVYHELSKPSPVFQETGRRRWLVDASFSLEELNRRLDLALDAEGADRLSGWLAAHLGRVPASGDTVEAQGCRVTVLKTDHLRVTLAQIEPAGETPA